MAAPTRRERQPNEALRALRQSRMSPSRSNECLSRPELADMVNRELAAMRVENQDVDGNYVGKLEQGRIRCPREASRREAFRRALGVSDDADLGFFAFRSSAIDLARDTEQAGRRSREENFRIPRSGAEVPPRTDAGADTSVDHGVLVNETRDVRSIGTELVEFASALDQRGIGSAELTAAEIAVELLDHQFAQLAPDEVLAKSRMLMKHVAANLREPQTLRHHERLVKLGARLAGLRAWACFDVNDHDEADRWYEIAVDAAQEAKAWGLGAWLLGAQSLIPWHRRDLRRTIDLIERGIYFAGQGSDATTRAWLYALHARGYAGTGNHDRFDTSYALAQEAAEYSTERDRRHGMDFAHGTLDLRYYSGTSSLLLREPERAHSELSGSLAALPESHTKAQAVLTLFLADAAVQTGDARRAVHLTKRALDSTMHQPIQPILQQGRRIRRLVEQRQPATAGMLDDPIHQFSEALTAVTTMARS